MGDMSDIDRKLDALPQQKQRVDGRKQDGTFAAGGIPGPGRPKGIRAMVRELTRDGEEPLEVLCAMMRDKLTDGDGNRIEVPIPIRKAAATELLDRGWGKPTQPIMPDEREIDAAIEKTLAELGRSADALH